MNFRAFHGEPIELKIHPPVGAWLHPRPTAQIAREYAASRIDEQIEALTRVAAALNDNMHELGKAPLGILFGQTCDFHLNRFIRLAGQKPGGVPVHISQKRDRRSGEKREVNQRQSEGGCI